MDLSRYTTRASALIHEIQTERGMSAVYIGSSGQNMVAELPEQIINTTEKYGEFQDFLRGFDAKKYGAEFESLLAASLSRLREMPAIRVKTKGLQHSKGDAFSFYTGTISQLFETFKQVVIQAGGSKLVTPISAYFNLMYGKEKAAIERALMAGDAAANTSMSNEDLETWMEVWKGQLTYLANFESFASEDTKKMYNVNLSGTVEDKVIGIRNNLLENHNEGNYAYTGLEVFQATTARIKILKTVEDFQADEIMRIAATVSASSRNCIMIYSFLGLVVMAAVLTFSLTVAGSITERMEAEKESQRYANELARSNQELEQFAYLISHDLRTPLRAVTGFADLLVERYQGKLDRDARECLAYIVDSSQQMSAMIEGLLQISRIQAESFKFETVPMDQIIEDVLRLVSKIIEVSDAQITVEKPMPRVQVVRSLMRQLFQNLIENALKFRGDNPTKIHISSKIEGPDWICRVTDNGIGIEPGKLERIFEMFYRIHESKQIPGYGIGLALCKRIVDRHGGRIWVESDGKGKGSTFCLTLPGKVD